MNDLKVLNSFNILKKQVFVFFIALPFFFPLYLKYDLRIVSFFLILVTILYKFRIVLKGGVVLPRSIFFTIIAFFAYSIMVAILNDVNIYWAVNWFVSVFFVLLFIVFFYCINLTRCFYIVYYLCIFFNVIFYSVFCGMLIFGDELGQFISEFIFIGWFYIRESGYPQVYFQATPLFLFFSVFFGMEKKYVLSFFSFGVLVLSLSRFGVVVVIFQFLILSIYSNIAICSLIAKSFKIISILVLFVFLIIYIITTEDICAVEEMNGIEIRLAHLYSVFKYLNFYDLKALLFGMGPGSFFYSCGFLKYTNNIEISQLELLRKYGLFGYLLFSFFFSAVLNYFYRQKVFSMCFSMFGFYIFSFSNPVLFSTPFFFIVSLFVYKTIVTLNNNKNHKEIIRG